MMDVKDLNGIYQSYGFEIDRSFDEIMVYAYKRGRYFGVDIIILEESSDNISKANKLKDEYSRSGYATTVKNIKSLQDAEDELFKSFFSHEATNARLQRRYQEFVRKQSLNLLDNNYEYVSSPFEIFNAESQSELINFVKEKLIDDSKACLIIIEAAAGYGKTSTAYELLDSITQKINIIRAPILTELSRNRGAKIFRYILLDEIDKEYPTLNSELVIREIKTGRVPLIIDGFDELLDKVNLEADISSLDDIEPMLDTIGNLLVERAKIILTTRKTAIFNGSEFENWMTKWNDIFEVIRISIKEPSIEDWLGEERCQLLEELNVPLHHIANPVLLAYLKNLSKTDFSIEVSNSENLVSQYFNRMLEREKIRQNLLINKETQFEIFKNVAKLMILFDITSESREFFREIIKEENLKILENTRSLYPEKPTIDNLVDSLSTHALLDRKGRDGNQIGFINDFVLGTFVGTIINERESEIDDKDFSSYMIELAVTAFRVQSENNRVKLWQKIMQISSKFSDYSLFIFDITLLNTLTKDYSSMMVKEISFVGTSFVNQKVADSVFINCTFKRCRFNFDKLDGVSFINCHFKKCENINTNLKLEEYKKIITLHCTQTDCEFLHDIEYPADEEVSDDINAVEKNILTLMWDYNIAKKHYISSIIQKIHNASLRKVGVALQNLESKGFVVLKGSQLQLRMNKIEAVKQILSK